MKFCRWFQVTIKSGSLFQSPAVQTESIELNGLHINIVRSRRRKTLSLEVGHGGVRARAPQHMPVRVIKKFVVVKQEWIRQHLENLPKVVEPLQLKDGSEIMLQGQNYRLRVISGRDAVKVDSRQQIIIPVTESHLPIQQTVQRKLTKWYRQLALQQLQLTVTDRLGNMLPGKAVPGIKVRDYKRRWGSCNQRGDLSFNWRIVMAPQTVLEYVAVHEIAHLTEFNHSSRFWRIVEQQMPDWRKQQQWLSDHGSRLYRL